MCVGRAIHQTQNTIEIDGGRASGKGNVKGSKTEMICTLGYDRHKAYEASQLSIRTQMQHSHKCVEDQQRVTRMESMKQSQP